MHSVIVYIYTIFWFLICVAIGSESINSEFSTKSSLDSLIQEYAFKALSWPKTKTGTAYEGTVPSNLSGIKISALMLRRDSLKWRGYGYYHEFLIPTGITVEPYVTRIVLVYQNLGNWSSFYYPLPIGYIYQTPILGILTYDAMDMCAKNKSQLQIHPLENPVDIKFSDVTPESESEESLLKCVYFDSNNSIEFSNVTNGNICSTRKQGHFAIVAEVNVAPSPAPSADDGNDHRIITSEVWTISLGFLGFAFLGVLFVFAQNCILVETRPVFLEDSAAIIVPLLTEVPMGEEAPSRSSSENDYAIRPLPENDYMAQIN
ncbi:uncharacterized protein [Solanum tuberosum]|uniref:Uncharacterized protein n=1 Tax=Solanum tuberosum TaxID=4113 RepID=M0ZNW1_SOLTU|nr:PREDICTED: uncharacterized protein LOC102596917 [Solanum tuberosum]